MLFEKPTLKKSSRKESILKILHDTLYNSAAQVLLKIYESPSKINKLFWFVSITGLTSYCCYEILMCITAFLAFEVSTTTRHISEIPITFPTVTICNRNMFTTEYAFDFLKQVIEENDYSVNIFNRTLMQSKNFTEREKDIYNLKYKASAIASNKNFSNDMRKLLGSSMKEFIEGCRFNTKECELERDFEWRYDPIYGNCFMFNSYDGTGEKATKYVEKAGKLNGLVLTLNLRHSPESRDVNLIAGVTLKIDDSLSQLKGLGRITSNEIGLISLLPDLETNIVVRRVVNKQMSWPYSTCEIDNDSPKKIESVFYDMFVRKGVRYTQQKCLDLCNQDMILNACKCTDVESISFMENTENCYTHEDIECLDEVLGIDSASNFTRDCLSLCPLECNETWFETYFSFSKLLMPELFPVQCVNVTSESGAHSCNRLKVNIYYDSLSYSLITETPTHTAISLLSNIGGILSLFLGLSIMSFFEVIGVFIEIAYLFYEEKSVRTKIQSSKNAATSDSITKIIL